MPTYEYRCADGHEFELFQRMSDEPRAQCPECGKEAQRLLSSGAGFLFKGDGFYITDYRSDAYKKAAEKDQGTGKQAAETKETKETKGSESPAKGEKEKTASKPDTKSSTPAPSGTPSSASD